LHRPTSTGNTASSCHEFLKILGLWISPFVVHLCSHTFTDSPNLSVRNGYRSPCNGVCPHVTNDKSAQSLSAVTRTESSSVFSSVPRHRHGLIYGLASPITRTRKAASSCISTMVALSRELVTHHLSSFMGKSTIFGIRLVESRVVWDIHLLILDFYQTGRFAVSSKVGMSIRLARKTPKCGSLPLIS
jgi:hypothetical protein